MEFAGKSLPKFFSEAVNQSTKVGLVLSFHGTIAIDAAKIKQNKKLSLVLRGKSHFPMALTNMFILIVVMGKLTFVCVFQGKCKNLKRILSFPN